MTDIDIAAATISSTTDLFDTGSISKHNIDHTPGSNLIAGPALYLMAAFNAASSGPTRALMWGDAIQPRNYKRMIAGFAKGEVADFRRATGASCETRSLQHLLQPVSSMVDDMIELGFEHKLEEAQNLIASSLPDLYPDDDVTDLVDEVRSSRLPEPEQRLAMTTSMKSRAEFILRDVKPAEQEERLLQYMKVTMAALLTFHRQAMADCVESFKVTSPKAIAAALQDGDELPPPLTPREAMVCKQFSEIQSQLSAIHKQGADNHKQGADNHTATYGKLDAIKLDFEEEAARADAGRAAASAWRVENAEREHAAKEAAMKEKHAAAEAAEDAERARKKEARMKEAAAFAKEKRTTLFEEEKAAEASRKHMELQDTITRNHKNTNHRIAHMAQDAHATRAVVESKDDIKKADAEAAAEKKVAARELKTSVTLKEAGVVPLDDASSVQTRARFFNNKQAEASTEKDPAALTRGRAKGLGTNSNTRRLPL